MKPPIDFSPLVQRACKFLKIGNRNETISRRKTVKGISFSNDVYQGTCKPIENDEELLSAWYRNSASNVTAKEHSTSPRSSVRIYHSPWGRRENTSKFDDYEEIDEIKEEPTKMDEGIFTIELIKPPNGYLGLVLVGGTDTPLQKHYVKDILPNSTASKDGSVRIGDEIIEVNGHSLRGRSHSLALAVIHSLPQVITIVVERSKDANKSILSTCLYQDDFAHDACADPNITSPKARRRKRSVLQNANDSSIISKSVNTVMNIQRKGSNAMSKPAKQVKRESKCTSFIVGENIEDDEDDTTFECEEAKSNKDVEIHEDSNSDCDDRLSMLSNTSAWCARQMMNCKADDQTVNNNDCESFNDTTSVFSMSTLSDSLPPPYTEQDCKSDYEQAPFTRYGSLRTPRRALTESIIEVDSDEEGDRDPVKPAMFLRRGSLRVRGSFSLRGSGCEESEEERATWPTTVRRQRTSLNWDTFVPPPNKPIRRSSSACARRPLSMHITDVHSSHRESSESSHSAPRKLQRTNSGRYIDKKTLTTKVYRLPTTGEWSFTIAGGSYSPYGDLPIHVLHVKDSLFTGSLKNGDEIVSFGGENFSNVTVLEADKKMKNFEGNCATVITKRKFLQRKKTQVCSSYADAWNEQARTSKRLKNRPESLYC